MPREDETMRLVPVEPTKAMIDAGYEPWLNKGGRKGRSIVRGVYLAMIHAALSPIPLHEITEADRAWAMEEALKLKDTPMPAIPATGAMREKVEKAVREASRGHGNEGVRIGSAKWCGRLTDAILAALKDEALSSNPVGDNPSADPVVKDEAGEPVACHHEAYQGQCAHCGVKIENGRVVRTTPAGADRLGVAVEALKRIATVDMGGGFLGALACRKVATVALSTLGAGE